MPRSFAHSYQFGIHRDVEMEAAISWKTPGNAFTVDLRPVNAGFESSYSYGCATSGKGVWGPWVETCKYTGVENLTLRVLVRGETYLPDEYTVTVKFRELKD